MHCSLFAYTNSEMRNIAFIFSSIFVFVTSARTTSAHVAYVTNPESLTHSGGTDFTFLFSPLTNINNMMMILCFLLMIGATYYLGHNVPKLIKELSFIKKQLMSYSEYVPWILRLGLGIMLLGAGLHGVLISPVAPAVTDIAAVELIVGFSLLLGFLITPSLLIIIGFYLAGLIHNGYMFGSLEVLAAAISLFLLADNRPSFDNIVGIPMLFRNRLAKYVPLILRIGVGATFIFLAFYEKIFNPHFFSTVVQSFNLTSIIPVSSAMWTLSVGLIELLVGIFIIFGFKTRITSAIAFCVFITTFFFFKESVFSHVSIFAGLSALFILGGGIYSIDEYIENTKKTTKTKATTLRKPAKRKTRKKTIARKSTSKSLQ